MSNDLRVEKREERVSLFMVDGVIFDGIVFLSQYAMLHSGEQTVLDLLLDTHPFLPARSNSGEFHLIQKKMISHVRCKVPLNEDLEYKNRQVKISFPGNETLQGTLKIDMPGHSFRLTDYINSSNNFFPLFSGQIAYLVNCHLIRDIALIDG